MTSIEKAVLAYLQRRGMRQTTTLPQVAEHVDEIEPVVSRALIMLIRNGLVSAERKSRAKYVKKQRSRGRSKAESVFRVTPKGMATDTD